jgi:hypothetical protein
MDRGQLTCIETRPEAEAEHQGRWLKSLMTILTCENLAEHEPETVAELWKSVPKELHGTSSKDIQAYLTVVSRWRDTLSNCWIGYREFELAARKDLKRGTITTWSPAVLQYHFQTYRDEQQARPAHSNGGGGGHDGRPSGSGTRPCGFFNNPKGCKKGKSCDKPHKCGNCGSSAHAKPDCPRKGR